MWSMSRCLQWQADGPAQPPVGNTWSFMEIRVLTCSLLPPKHLSSTQLPSEASASGRPWAATQLCHVHRGTRRSSHCCVYSAHTHTFHLALLGEWMRTSEEETSGQGRVLVQPLQARAPRAVCYSSFSNWRGLHRPCAVAMWKTGQKRTSE